jgi:hypothetical protein
MALTFRSTTPETRTVVEQEADGRQRVAVAIRDHGSTRHWNLQVRHPSGEHWSGTYTGDTNNVVTALNEMLARTENEFRTDKARGDRPRPTVPDFSRPVEGYAPIRGIPGRQT